MIKSCPCCGAKVSEPWKVHPFKMDEETAIEALGLDPSPVQIRKALVAIRLIPIAMRSDHDRIRLLALGWLAAERSVNPFTMGEFPTIPTNKEETCQ